MRVGQLRLGSRRLAPPFRPRSQQTFRVSSLIPKLPFQEPGDINGGRDTFDRQGGGRLNYREWFSRVDGIPSVRVGLAPQIGLPIAWRPRILVLAEFETHIEETP